MLTEPQIAAIRKDHEKRAALLITGKLGLAQQLADFIMRQEDLVRNAERLLRHKVRDASQVSPSFEEGWELIFRGQVQALKCFAEMVYTSMEGEFPRWLKEWAEKAPQVVTEA